MATSVNSQPVTNVAVNAESEQRSRKVAERISENLHIIANEPSLALYRLQEHVRKSLPQLVEKRFEVNRMHHDLQGKCYDAEYAVNAVKSLQSSTAHFQNIHDLLKNAIFMKQQLTYEENRRLCYAKFSQSKIQSGNAHSMAGKTVNARQVCTNACPHCPSILQTSLLPSDQWRRYCLLQTMTTILQLLVLFRREQLIDKELKAMSEM